MQFKQGIARDSNPKLQLHRLECSPFTLATPEDRRVGFEPTSVRFAGECVKPDFASGGKRQGAPGCQVPDLMRFAFALTTPHNTHAALFDL